MALARSSTAKSSRRASGHPSVDLARVARLFSVLAEPTRLMILHRLQSGPASVGQLVESLGMKQANASKQLGMLHQAELVSRQRDGNIVRYGISEPMVFDLCDLVCGKLVRDAQRVAEEFGGRR